MSKIEIMASHLYVIQCEHFFKIGTTTSRAYHRKKAMDTGNPFTLSVVLDITFKNDSKGYNLEQKFHKKYKKKRTKGEWFAIKPTDIFSIKDVCIKDSDFLSIIEEKIREPFKGEKKSNDYWDNKYLNELARFSQRDIKWQYMMRDHDYFREATQKFKLRLDKKQERLNEKEKELKKIERSFNRAVRDFDIYKKIDQYIDTLPKRFGTLVSKLEELKLYKND